MSFGCPQFLQKKTEQKQVDLSIIAIKLNSFVYFLKETLARKNDFDFF